MTVMNHGATVDPWTIAFDLPAGVGLQNGWNGDYADHGHGDGHAGDRHRAGLEPGPGRR